MCKISGDDKKLGPFVRNLQEVSWSLVSNTIYSHIIYI